MILAATIMVASGAAQAQQAGTTFRLAKNPSNLGPCTGLDAAMGREHTVVPAGNTATLSFPGGVPQKMQQVSPAVYRAQFALGRVTVEFVADLSKSPKTLVAKEAREGCQWSGQAR
jgi:hypothetical protein